MAWPPVTRDDLKEAANRDGFATTFPALIRRLVAETALGLVELDMPSESGVSVGGFDGVVTATVQTVEVPSGSSVWELSVTDKSGKKSDGDYNKRLTGPDGGPAGELTYVQVILSVWKNAQAWGAQRSKEGRWKQVRGYNLDTVHGWLDKAPATAVWLAARLGKEVLGAQAADDWLDRTWTASTRVPLTVDFVLAGRQAAAAALRAALAGGRPAVTVAADVDADEFRAFVAASLETADEPERTTLKARALLVSDTAALARLVEQPQPLVLVLADARLAADVPARAGHQFAVLAAPGGPADVELGPVDAEAVSGLLRLCGRLGRTRPTRSAAGCYCSAPGTATIRTTAQSSSRSRVGRTATSRTRRCGWPLPAIPRCSAG